MVWPIFGGVQNKGALDPNCLGEEPTCLLQLFSNLSLPNQHQQCASRRAAGHSKQFYEGGRRVPPARPSDANPQNESQASFLPTLGSQLRLHIPAQYAHKRALGVPTLP